MAPRRSGADHTGETTTRLVERARAGDTSALDLLFARYAEPLRRWASGRLPRWARDAADTQDMVQDVLLQTFKKIDSFEPRGHGAFQAYIRQALVNRIRDVLRRSNRRGLGEALDSGVPSPEPSPVEKAIGRDLLDRYERALLRLSPDEREAIIGRVEFAYTYAELAEALGKPSPDAARKAAQKALLRLAAEMKSAG